MRIVLAPDSFKESMTAREAVSAMVRGIATVLPRAECVLVPMADGGEGTAGTVVDALGGTLLPARVRDPLGRQVLGEIGLVADGRTAVLEVASAIGLGLLAPAERDPTLTGTAGVADLLLAALDRGVGRVVVGLGGSATNDAGLGMLAALGARLLPASPLREDWGDLAAIDLTGLDPRLAAIDLDVACDVTAPLLGPHGSSRTFGRQKGASPAQVELLERRMVRAARALDLATGAPVSGRPGAGAAGGLGAALLALGGRLEPGVDLVARTVGLGQALVGADLVLTGEGTVDAESLHGKVVGGVIALAAAAGVPVVVLTGRRGAGAERVESLVEELVTLSDGHRDLAEALATGPRDLERAVAGYLAARTAGAGRDAADG